MENNFAQQPARGAQPADLSLPHSFASDDADFREKASPPGNSDAYTFFKLSRTPVRRCGSDFTTRFDPGGGPVAILDKTQPRPARPPCFCGRRSYVIT